jgi:long-chain acyl-CoA synthetase
MSEWEPIWPAMREEAHFKDRVVTCFVDRVGSLYELLSSAYKKNPNGEAIVCGDQRLRYADLFLQCSQFATGLQKYGVIKGDRVAILLENRSEFVVTLFATAMLGAVAVPMSVREQAPGIAYMLGHCGAKVVVHETYLAELLPTTDDAPELSHRVAVGFCEGSDLFSEWLLDSDLTSGVEVAEEDTAVILYTSGTTGRPKGAMLTNLGIVHSSMHFQIAMGLSARDCSIAAVPLSHVTGLVALITTMVSCAGKLVIMSSFKAKDFLKLAEREQMTHTLMVPAMYNLCLLQEEFAQSDLSSWRIGGFGGAPMPVASIEQLTQKVPTLTLMNCYGSTETTSPATLIPKGKVTSHLDSVGVPLACAEIRVMDDHGCEVTTDTLGEIWIKGPMVVTGYWDNPDATSENFTAGFWHSGDIGSIDAKGYVKVLDRKKDMINRGGYKIYTIEVENALYAHPAVQECAVVSKPCPVLGERVHAFVMLKDCVVTSAELTTHCSARLSDYKVPESFTLTQTALPRNANGKLLKKVMRDSLLEGLQT